MAVWSFLDLAVIGDKKDVNAFDRVAMQLPVLSDYVIEKKGRPVTTVMFEDMVSEKPRRWRNYWWRSEYHFQTKNEKPAVAIIRRVSNRFPYLCFWLDCDCEHEEFRTHFIRNGRIESHKLDARQRIDDLYQRLTNGAEDCDLDDVDSQIDETVVQEMAARFKRLWQPKIHRILDARRRRKAR